MQKSRVNNVIKNFAFGAGTQVVSTIISFISRTVFIYVLGASYLGISSLYTSILVVLSLAELGVGNVVIYSLYKPVAEENRYKISQLVQFYKKIYLSIATFVFVVGLAIVPFLQNILKLDEHIPNLTLFYILYLLNSVISYLFVYKTSVLRADQKQYVISLYTTLFQLLTCVFQIIVLLIFKSFIFYLVIQILFTFFTNYSISKYVDKLYPYIKNRVNTLSKMEKKKIFSDTKSMMSYKVGGVLLNSTDNMFISAFVSTVTVGLYNNYLMLAGVLNKLINITYESLYASVGNLNASTDRHKQLEIFNVMVLAFLWIGCFTTVGFYSLASEIIAVWIGSQYLINNLALLALSLNFYLPIVLYPIWMFRNTTGIFKETANILLYAALINLILSYILGNQLGLWGILIATSISRLITSFWFEPVILYKKLFKGTSRKYFVKIITNIVVIVLAIACVELSSVITPDNIIIRIIVKSAICLVIPNLLMLILYRKSEEFLYLKKLVINKIKVKFRNQGI